MSQLEVPMTPAQNANKRKNANSVAPPGGSYQYQEQSRHLMCHLATRVEPSGGFWKKSKNPNKIMPNKVGIMQYFMATLKYSNMN